MHISWDKLYDRNKRPRKHHRPYKHHNCLLIKYNITHHCECYVYVSKMKCSLKALVSQENQVIWESVYNQSHLLYFISSVPLGWEWKFRYVVIRLILMLDGWNISCGIAPRWMSLDLANDKPILTQLNVRCRQKTSYYLSQCRLSLMSTDDVTKRNLW